MVTYQGIVGANGFRRSALPTARGDVPSCRASSAYVLKEPRGICAVSDQTARSKGVPRAEVWRTGGGSGWGSSGFWLVLVVASFASGFLAAVVAVAVVVGAALMVVVVIVVDGIVMSFVRRGVESCHPRYLGSSIGSGRREESVGWGQEWVGSGFWG